MTFHGWGGKVWNSGVGDSNLSLDIVGYSSQAGAEDDANLGFETGSISYRLDAFLNLLF